MERVRTVTGVEYINDSKGTNVGAVMKSLEGLTTPVILIAGGRDKGSDFSPLREAVYRKVKKLIVLGEASEKIADAFSDHPAIVRVGSMSEAVATAHATAKQGDVVLLSPACASFDQFKNFEHRGEVFKTEVEKLAGD
jgi:UDP-N-acetylmuramoylalanine--D-glutamate ligase